MKEVVISNNVVATVGMPVVIENNKTLSHLTKGSVAGFRKTASGSTLVMVRYHPKAPPICVKPESVKTLLPRKFWMLCGNIPEDLQYRHDSSLSVRNSGHNAPRRKFYSREEVDRILPELRRHYPRVDWIVMESVGYVNSANTYKM